MSHDERRELHRSSIVIDAVCPLASESFEYLEWYREGGVSTLAPTVGGIGGAREALGAIAKWRQLLVHRDDLAHARSGQFLAIGEPGQQHRALLRRVALADQIGRRLETAKSVRQRE